MIAATNNSVIYKNDEAKEESRACFIFLFGKVQKVGFRKKICVAANNESVVGWVRNHRHGHVEILLQGSRAKVSSVIAAIQADAYGTEIENCVIVKSGPTELTTFSITQTETALSEPSLIRARLGFISKELRAIASATINLNISEADSEVTTEILSELPARYWPDSIKKSSSKFSGAVSYASCSFTAELWSSRSSSRSSKADSFRPDTLLNRKDLGSSFARMCGIQTPQVYGINLKFLNIAYRNNIVIKPTDGAGSNGVFLVYSSTKIYDVKNKVFYSSWAELECVVELYLTKTGRPDSWIVEDFIRLEDGGAPNDLKFYCFYGKAPLALEVVRSNKGTKYCWWNRRLNVVNTGKYSNFLFRPSPFDSDFFNVADELSLKIPLPFIRIDFFKLESEMVFGEFTPQPGNFHMFDTKTDTWLGKEYAEARGRLISDLYRGKDFAEFESLKIRSQMAG